MWPAARSTCGEASVPAPEPRRGFCDVTGSRTASGLCPFFGKVCPAAEPADGPGTDACCRDYRGCCRYRLYATVHPGLLPRIRRTTWADGPAAGAAWPQP